MSNLHDPHERQAFETLVERTGIDPQAQVSERNGYDASLEMAERFVTWASGVELQPLYVDMRPSPNFGQGDKVKHKVTLEVPRMLKALGRHRNDHGHGDHGHEDHGHHAESNLILPHLSIEKRRLAGERSKFVYRELWPVGATPKHGIAPVSIDVGLVGSTLRGSGDSASVGLFSNSDGRVNLGDPQTLPYLQEVKPITGGEGIVPDHLSAVSILRAVAHYSVTRNKDHGRF